MNPSTRYVQSFSKRWTDCATAPSWRNLNEGRGESMLEVRGSGRSSSAAARLRNRTRNPSIFLRRTICAVSLEADGWCSVWQGLRQRL
ncbi:hypothetical protein Y032_0420g1138 [Ancylostoma ceylanicum]|nr:hypothetical protein Y032_0420g1138 [Ancylostoma ceylanicum]